MTDGDVVGALERFQRAVVGLVDPITATVEGALRQAPSLYARLASDVSGTHSQAGLRKSVPSSRPTVWCAALDLSQAMGRHVRERTDRLAREFDRRICIRAVRSARVSM
jgi:hypothetical protein